MRYKIHPAFGIARTGDSPETFVGPETTDPPAPPTGGYKDSNFRIRRQGARFRVFDHSGLLSTEVTHATITWTVLLGRAGVQAPPAIQLTGANQSASFAKVPLPNGSSGGVSFGDVRTEEAGHLVVVGGLVNGGFDGICSGWVKATVTTASGTEDAMAAWVVVAPPNYSPHTRSIVSAYDRLFDAFHAAWGLSVPAKPRYVSDIWPILRSFKDWRPEPAPAWQFLPWLFAKAARKAVSDQLPVDTTFEDEVPKVTATQKKILDAWVNGSFVDDSSELGVPRAITTAELDRGALDHCLVLGTAWELGPDVLASASNYVEPFRPDPSKVGLGFGSNTVGWQNDFNACVSEWAMHSGGLVHPIGSGGPPFWHTRGFVIRESDTFKYVEESASSGFTATPYLFLVTPTVDFGTVTKGHNATAAIELEIGSQPQQVTLSLEKPLPAGVTAAATQIHGGPNAVNHCQTLLFSLTLHASTVGDFFGDALVKGPGAVEYLVRLVAKVVS
jgi:hypothetical protein